jgi:hypothetical protein
MHQQLFDFVTRSPKLGTREREGYYVVFLSIHTKIPDTNEEWGGGFSTKYTTKTHSKRLCIIAQSTGRHVLNECVRRYYDEYTKPGHEYVKKIVGDEEVVRVEVSYTYPETDLEVYEIFD